MKSEIPRARAEIFNHCCLGEMQGWSGVRPEPEKTLRKLGYTWTDTKYDYLATLETGDFEHPVPRAAS